MVNDGIEKVLKGLHVPSEGRRNPFHRSSNNNCESSDGVEPGKKCEDLSLG